MTDDKALVAAMKDQMESWEFEDPRESWWKWQHQYAQAADRIEALEAEVERLRERLEIDPSHPYDGIYARDETIRGLDAKVERLEERLGEAYQIAGHIAVEYDGNGKIERLLDLLAGINLGEKQ